MLWFTYAKIITFYFYMTTYRDSLKILHLKFKRYGCEWLGPCDHDGCWGVEHADLGLHPHLRAVWTLPGRHLSKKTSAFSIANTSIHLEVLILNENQIFQAVNCNVPRTPKAILFSFLSLLLYCISLWPAGWTVSMLSWQTRRVESSIAAADCWLTTTSHALNYKGS